MARIRTTKPEFWSDGMIARLPYEGRLLYMGMWNFADDHGCISDDALQIKMQVFPADTVDVAMLLYRLVCLCRIKRYHAADGRTFYHIVNFERHQRVDKPGSWTFGEPSTWTPCHDTEPSENIPRTFDDCSDNVLAGKERKDSKDSKGESSARAREGSPIPGVGPKLEQVVRYMSECGYDDDPNIYFEHRKSAGWKRNGDAILDWQADIRLWHQRGIDRAARGNGSGPDPPRRQDANDRTIQRLKDQGKLK